MFKNYIIQISVCSVKSVNNIHLLIQVTDMVKYPGVIISNDIQWEKHFQATAANASQTLGFLRRTFRDGMKQVRYTTCKSMVLSSMEFASTSWDPYKVDVNCLDNVQRRTAHNALDCSIE